MSRESSARAGAQAALPGDQILDVAVVMPRGSTRSALLGATVGVVAGGNNATGWGVAGGMLGQRANSAAHGSYPSIVLAVSPSRLYILGRRSTGLVGGWKHLVPVTSIHRADLQVARRRHGTVTVIDLTDTTTGTTLAFESAHLGGLGLNELLAPLSSAS